MLGYLLNALEPDEHMAVEQSLRRNPQLKEELRRLRVRLAFLERTSFGTTGSGCDDFDGAEADLEPPPGLADRTLQFIGDQIAAQRDSDSLEQPGSLAELPVRKSDDISVPPDDRPYVEPIRKRSWRGAAARDRMPGVLSSWRFADIAMALAVCICASALALPMISASRSNAQVMACANNERQIGVGLAQYSEHHNGYFPRIAESGSLAAAGIYAPTLLSGGYVESPRVFVCPGSSAADDQSLRIPTIAEIQQMSGQPLVKLRRQMGGSYGYALGYRQGGVYRPTRNLYREAFALVADMPSDDHASSPNHNGSGHNVLLEDGHVVFLTTCRMDGSTDDIFTNDEGKVAAGCHINDAVVVQSDVSP